MVASKFVVLLLLTTFMAIAVAQDDDDTDTPTENPDCNTDGTCPVYATYKCTTDVRERGEIDLDVEAMAKSADEFKFGEAKSMFESGEHSLTSSGGKRTLAGFSTNAQEKMSGEPEFEKFKAYFGASDYANQYVKEALDGVQRFSGADNFARAETAVKGAQYQAVLMYVIHEMEDAVGDCKAGDVEDNDGGAKAWDEAVAFYTGSAVGDTSTGASSSKGELQYGLALSRFGQFDGAKDINAAIFEQFTKGQSALDASNCGMVEEATRAIIDLMKIPLLQGLIRYAWKGDENGPAAESENLPKAQGEGNAFATALLPWIHETDSKVAEFIAEQFPYTGRIASAGYDKVLDEVAKLYGKGDFSTISADDVGVLIEAQSSEDDGGVSGGAIAGIVIGALALVAVLLVIFFLWKRRSSKVSMYEKEAPVDNGARAGGAYVPPEP